MNERMKESLIAVVLFPCQVCAQKRLIHCEPFRAGGEIAYPCSCNQVIGYNNDAHLKAGRHAYWLQKGHERVPIFKF